MFDCQFHGDVSCGLTFQSFGHIYVASFPGWCYDFNRANCIATAYCHERIEVKAVTTYSCLNAKPHPVHHEAIDVFDVRDLHREVRDLTFGITVFQLSFRE
jgi:hypothetical protein